MSEKSQRNKVRNIAVPSPECSIAADFIHANLAGDPSISQVADCVDEGAVDRLLIGKTRDGSNDWP